MQYNAARSGATVAMNTQARFPAVPFGIAVFGIATFAGMDAVMKGLAIDMGA